MKMKLMKQHLRKPAQAQREAEREQKRLERILRVSGVWDKTQKNG